MFPLWLLECRPQIIGNLCREFRESGWTSFRKSTFFFLRPWISTKGEGLFFLFLISAKNTHAGSVPMELRVRGPLREEQLYREAKSPNNESSLKDCGQMQGASDTDLMLEGLGHCTSCHGGLINEALRRSSDTYS